MRALNCLQLFIPLYWDLRVMINERSVRGKLNITDDKSLNSNTSNNLYSFPSYSSLLQIFSLLINCIKLFNPIFNEFINIQKLFLSKLCKVFDSTSNLNRIDRCDKLKRVSKSFFDPSSPFPSPIDCRFFCYNLIVDKLSVFKSKVQPVLLVFDSVKTSSYLEEKMKLDVKRKRDELLRNKLSLKVLKGESENNENKKKEEEENQAAHSLDVDGGYVLQSLPTSYSLSPTPISNNLKGSSYNNQNNLMESSEGISNNIPSKFFILFYFYMFEYIRFFFFLI
jgi:hypothetical protein